MTTESPIRITETSRKWPSCKEAAELGQSSANMAVEEVRLLLRDQMFQKNGRNKAPNRSGSAPPSMEGSISAVQNFISLHTSTSNISLTSLNSTDGGMNQHLICHIGSIVNNWRLTSLDDCGNGSLQLSCGNLPTHPEEIEEDRSPQQAVSLIQRQIFDDLIQEDFPCTLSSAYNQSRSSSHIPGEDSVECDDDSSSVCDLSFNANISSNSTDDLGESLCSDQPPASKLGLTSLGATGSLPTQPSVFRRHISDVSTRSRDETKTNSVSDSNVRHLEYDLKAMNLSSLTNSGKFHNQKDLLCSDQNNAVQQQLYQLQSNAYQVQGAQSQILQPGINHPLININQVQQGPSDLSAGVQPIFHSSGLTPPLYATAAAYMNSTNPYYANLQPPGYFAPQYSVGGYAYNPQTLQPFVTGYPPHNAIPVTFNGFPGPGFGQSSGISTGGSTATAPVVDMQHLNKYYGQLGFSMQPSSTDLHMQYFQQYFRDVQSASDQWASRGGAIGSQKFDSWKEVELGACLDDQKLQHGNGGYRNLNLRKGGIANPYYVGNPNLGVLMQFPETAVSGPVLQASPVGRTNFSGGKNELKFLPASGRNAGGLSGWQGQGEHENLDGTKTISFLEELKSGKGCRFELSDIAGHVIEFSANQHGSRFIQQKLESCSIEEKESVFKEVLPHASQLMTDVFGNYVIQKFFEYGSPEQRKELANQLEGQILCLSFQMYGCRVIQKALEVIELEQKTKLVCELDGHVIRCVRDQNGNHVIQKCIESIPTDKIGLILSSFRGQVATLSTHPYGCRVIQRVLEHCTDELQIQFIVDEILESVCALAQDQYGNYVTQHVLERGKPHERSEIISKFLGHIVPLSQHKFASNVVEKCLEHSDSAAREILIGEIIGHDDGNDNLLAMMKDQYANYVIQKILQTCSENQREMLLSRIRIHLNSLKKYTYGKHIVARFEQLCGEEVQS